MMIPIVDAIAQVSSIEPDDPSEAESGNNVDEEERAPLATPDKSEDATIDNNERTIILKVVDPGTADETAGNGNSNGDKARRRPPALAEIGKKDSKYFVSETFKKAAIERQRNLLLMAVAYSANIGGTGVVTGSPPNLVVPQVMENRFGDSTGLTFASWMAFAVPVMSVNLVISWLWLIAISWREERRHYSGRLDVTPAEEKAKQDKIHGVMRKKYKELGGVTCHEFSVLICFTIVILLWFFRRPLFMSGNIWFSQPEDHIRTRLILSLGWGDLFVYMTERGKKVTVGSATPAILMVLVVFALPTEYNFWPFQKLADRPASAPALIDWKTVEKRLPWGVILLLGGGFAVSDACEKSGLSKWLVAQLLILVNLPAWAICTIVCTLTAMLTQVGSM